MGIKMIYGWLFTLSGIYLLWFSLYVKVEEKKLLQLMFELIPGLIGLFNLSHGLHILGFFY